MIEQVCLEVLIMFLCRQNQHSSTKLDELFCKAIEPNPTIPGSAITEAINLRLVQALVIASIAIYTKVELWTILKICMGMKVLLLYSETLWKHSFCSIFRLISWKIIYRLLLLLSAMWSLFWYDPNYRVQLYLVCSVFPLWNHQLLIDLI